MIDWLKLPVYRDEEKNRTAKALQGILFVLLVVLVVISPVLYAFGYLPALVGCFYGIGSILITWVLLRIKRVQLASLFLLTSAVLLLDYFMLVGQGIHDVVIIALPMILVMAGLVLSRIAFLVLAGMVVVSTNFVIYADIQGLFDSGLQNYTTYADMLIVSSILITTVVIVRMLADNLLDSLHKTRQITQQQAALILESRGQAEQLRILNQISNAVAAGLDLDRMLEELYHQLKQVVPLDSFYVALIDEHLGLVTFPIFYSAGVRIEIPPESLDAGSGLTGEVIRSQKLLYLPDVAEPSVQDEHEIIAIGPGETRSYVGLPLHLHGEVFGVLSVQCQHPNAFIADQLRLLETITSQASVAIDNARLFVEVTGALRREERLNEVARIISGTLDLQFILENVVRLSVELLDADSGSLSLVTEDHEGIREVYNYRLPDQINSQPIRRDEGLTWWVIDRCQPVAVRDISQDPRANPDLKNIGFHALAGAPILAGDECLGMMNVLSANPLRVFVERDVAALDVIGRLAGSAIRNARLYAALQQELNERQRAENAIQQRDAILEAITYAAEQFLVGTDWRQKMPEIIARLGFEAGVSQAFLLQIDGPNSGPLHLSSLYAWNDPDTPVVFNPENHQNLPLKPGPLSRWCDTLQDGRTYLGTTDPASPHCFNDEEVGFFAVNQVGSLLSVPIFVNDQWWGAMGFSDCRTERNWLDMEVEALIVASGLLSSVIQRQQADEALREREALYRKAISAADAVPYYQDYRSNRYLFMGERILELSGYPSAEITPDLWDSLIEEAVLIGEGAGLTMAEAVARARKGRTPIWKCDYRIRTRAGETRWIADTSVEIIGPDQNSIGSIGILQDITERKTAEAALQESEERFRAIFENSATGIALGDLDGRILTANHSFQALLGYSAAELIERHFSDLIHPDFLEDEMRAIERLLSGEYDFFQAERIYLRKDGGQLWGRMTASLIHDEQGGPRYGLLLVDDISEQKRALEALHLRDCVLEAVVFAAETFLKAPDWREVIGPVLKRLCDEIGATHAYIYQAERAEDRHLLFTVRYEYVTESGLGDLGNPNSIHAPSENLGSKRWLYAMLRGEPYYGGVSSLPPEDVELMTLFRVLSFLDVPVYVGNEFWGVIGFEDSLKEHQWSEAEVDSLKVAAGVLGAAIQRQQSDEAVRKLNAELERRVAERTAELQIANRELESFAYSVSHDLRTPLRGIDGYSGLLLEEYHEALDQQGKLYLDNVRRATSQMSELIDDLLKLSRVTRLEMHRQVVDLSALAEQIVADFRQREPSREIEILIQPDLNVYGDANLLKLAFENLINNAWKFTRRNPRPRIEIAATHKKGRPIYYVRDNGVGFDMKYKEKLFLAFQRLHDSGDFEGTGIGLATVQRVIQRHSGSIWAEGEVEHGATFYFTLFDPGTVE